jgi:hypothetical protein
MNPFRRALVTGSALVLPALALAGCAALGTTAPAAGINASVQSVFNASQYVLPLLDVLLVGVSMVVPAAAPVIAMATPYLNAAGAAFQGLSLSMSSSAAQPIVQQIASNLSAVVKAATGIFTASGADPRLAALAPKLQQAQAVLGLLTAFVSGVSAMPTAATVRLPLLHG